MSLPGFGGRVVTRERLWSWHLDSRDAPLAPLLGEFGTEHVIVADVALVVEGAARDHDRITINLKHRVHCVVDTYKGAVLRVRAGIHLRKAGIGCHVSFRRFRRPPSSWSSP